MAAPVYVAKGTKASGTGATVAPTYMGGISANHQLLMLVCSVGLGTITVDAGWVVAMSGVIKVTPVATVKVYRKAADGTETGTTTVTRSGYSPGSFMAQIYQYSGTAYLTLESNPAYPTWGGTATTITWNALTIGGIERTLAALCVNYNGADPGTPTGYTNNATDNDGSGTYFDCNTLTNVSSDGSVTATGGSANGWTTIHISLYNAPAGSEGIITWTH